MKAIADVEETAIDGYFVHENEDEPQKVPQRELNVLVLLKDKAELLVSRLKRKVSA